MRADRVVAIVGVGPGLGASLARRFAREGYLVVLMARRRESVQPIEEEVRAAGRRALAVALDAGDPASVHDAFRSARDLAGDPDVLVYNASGFVVRPTLETSPEEFEDCWRATCYGAFLSVREVVPQMVQRGSGTVLLTGATASTRGSAGFAAFAVGKFGLRALSQSLAREVAPRGVHVAHVVIDGMIESGATASTDPRHPRLLPDAIAEAYWQLHVQPPSAWTLELDLRPSAEMF